MNPFLLTVIAIVITGVSVWLFKHREQHRLYSRMLEKQQRAVHDAHAQGVLVGKREGIREGQRVALEEIESRPWQSVAPVHKTVSPRS